MLRITTPHSHDGSVRHGMALEVKGDDVLAGNASFFDAAFIGSSFFKVGEQVRALLRSFRGWWSHVT